MNESRDGRKNELIVGSEPCTCRSRGDEYSLIRSFQTLVRGGPNTRFCLLFNVPNQAENFYACGG